ncbi:hypothetical protein CHS0354_032282 [Potamilus streckersoni]|uniref:Ig-like domain-containing protein n=1 Tax=Potamilus streckersoni TaxID=2493646 RepID=A0AAE0RPZ3_9BIVA|nr:hypothetical protein CHS0354_032282 [Potamilus streckersoni]
MKANVKPETMIGHLDVSALPCIDKEPKVPRAGAGGWGGKAIILEWQCRAFLMPNESVFHNGTDGFLTCTCMGTSLEWYYDESKILTTSNSRIQHQDSTIDSTKMSNLTFQPVLESDIGWYECRCKINISTVKVAGIRMVVRVPAQVEVYPLTQTVRNGSSASINCTLNNYAERVSFQWFKDGTPLQNESENLEYLLNGNTSHLEITNIAQSANYSCRGNSSAGFGNNATATVYVLNSKDQYCENQTDIRNTSWENTNSGTVNRKPCPSGFKGESLVLLQDSIEKYFSIS